VRTRQLAEEVKPFRADGTRDLTVGSANTSVIEHGGKILALVESSFPYGVTSSLNTVGPCDFGGRLTTAMTAHPKEDPATGELHFFGYGFTPPFLTYHRLSADGQLITSFPVEVGGPTMMHDFAITENHVVWLDLPVVFTPELIGRGIPYDWSDTYPSRIGVMAKDGGDAAKASPSTVPRAVRSTASSPRSPCRTARRRRGSTDGACLCRFPCARTRNSEHRHQLRNRPRYATAHSASIFL